MRRKVTNRMNLIKEIFYFIFNVSMFIWALWIISRGGNVLGIGVLALIPFVYLFYFFTKDITDKNDQIKHLQDNLDYYKHRIAQYEDIDN